MMNDELTHHSSLIIHHFDSRCGPVWSGRRRRKPETEGSNPSASTWLIHCTLVAGFEQALEAGEGHRPYARRGFDELRAEFFHLVVDGELDRFALRLELVSQSRIAFRAYLGARTRFAATGQAGVSAQTPELRRCGRRDRRES